jgi:hypothetical protein
MARTNYGFSGLNNSLNSQVTGLANASIQAALDTKNDLIAVRVTDIVLDDSHPKFNEVGGWTGLGAIFYTPVNSTPNPTSFPAYPNFNGIKQYPLINEIVYLLPLPGNLNSGNTKVRNYYIGGVNIWNHPHHNAFPSNPNIPPQTQRKSLAMTELGSTIAVSPEPQEVNLGNYFIERDDIHPIRPFEGDIICESRWGSSIRFGSTVKGTPNDWSDDDTSKNGDPIVIIRNGQGSPVYDPDEPTKDITKEAAIPIVEDINKNESSIYLSSTQKINLQAASTDYTSYKNSSTPPTSPDQFAGQQIILNSGRLVFNTKSDHILLSSAKSINLNSKESINIDTRKFVTQADKIFLGNEALATEPLLLGNTTVQLLRDLIYTIKEITTSLQNLQSTPVTGPGQPVFFPTLGFEATKVLVALESLEKQLGRSNETCTITSKRNFTL